MIMDAEVKVIISSLERIEALLIRIEERQVHTTSMVQDIEKQEQKQVVGSFAST